MNELGGFDYVLDWLKTSLNAKDLSQQEMDSVFAFMLMWNSFEGRLFPEERSLYGESLVKLSRASYTYPDDVINNVSLYFYNRYFVAKDGIKKFNNLQLKKEEKHKKEFLGRQNEREYVKGVLCNENSATSEKLAALLLITYQFRNNLFHGVKNIDALKDYDVPFKKINWLLKEIIEVCPRNWQ